MLDMNTHAPKAATERQPKYVALAQAIESIGSIRSKAQFLLQNIQAGPSVCASKDTNAKSQCSLAELLATGPELIYKECIQIEKALSDIREALL